MRDSAELGRGYQEPSTYMSQERECAMYGCKAFASSEVMLVEVHLYDHSGTVYSS